MSNIQGKVKEKAERYEERKRATSVLVNISYGLDRIVIITNMDNTITIRG